LRGHETECTGTLTNLGKVSPIFAPWTRIIWRYNGWEKSLHWTAYYQIRPKFRPICPPHYRHTCQLYCLLIKWVHSDTHFIQRWAVF